MKKRIICMSVVIYALLLSISGCGSTETNGNSNAGIITNINTSDNAAAETTSDLTESFSSGASEKTSSSESLKNGESSVISKNEGHCKMNMQL